MAIASIHSNKILTKSVGNKMWSTEVDRAESQPHYTTLTRQFDMVNSWIFPVKLSSWMLLKWHHLIYWKSEFVLKYQHQFINNDVNVLKRYYNENYYQYSLLKRILEMNGQHPLMKYCSDMWISEFSVRKWNFFCFWSSQ